MGSTFVRPIRGVEGYTANTAILNETDYISVQPIYRQSVVVVGHREKNPRMGSTFVRPIRGFEGCAANAALSR